MAMARGTYIFTIDGLEIADKIESFSWEYNDVDSPKSGRTLDAVMQRGRVTDKRKVSIKLVPVTMDECTRIISALRKQYVTISTNLLPEGRATFTAYNSARTGGVGYVGTDGVVRHKDVSFNIIER